MANSADVLKVVQVINALLGLVAGLGVSWDALAAKIARAKAEGREFDLTDLAQVIAEAEHSLASLKAAIEAAKDRPTPR